MSRHGNLFVLIFLLAFAVHALLWHSTTFIDEEKWVIRFERLYVDLGTGGEHLDPWRYSSHPGAFALVVALPFYAIGFSSVAAFKTSIACITATLVASTVVVLRSVRPGLPWWFAGGAVLLLHPLYFHVTPPVAVMAPLTVLLFVLGLFAYERAPSSFSALWLAFSICFGAALATRLVASFLVGIPLFVVLAFRHGFRLVLITFLIALSVMVFLNPFLWYAPLVHLAYVLLKVNEFAHTVLVHTLQPSDFIFLAPGALLSLAFGFVLFFFRKALGFPLSSPYFSSLLLATALLSFAVFRLPMQSLRYFFPLIFLWEVFLPLWVLSLASRTRLFSPWGVALLLVLGQAVLFCYVWLLPSRVHLI